MQKIKNKLFLPLTTLVFQQKIKRVSYIYIYVYMYLSYIIRALKISETFSAKYKYHQIK